MTRRSYALELAMTAFFSVTLAVLEGGVVGVFVKQAFDGRADAGVHNFIVALCAAAGELANILSFVWTSASHGRAKVPFINGLQLAVIGLVAAIAFMPISPVGLYGTAFCVITARICWSGIVTLRPTLWRANYPRQVRASIVGNFAVVQQLVAAIVGVGFGLAMDARPDAFRLLLPVACAIGLGGAVVYARVRVRGGPAALRQERELREGFKPWHGPLSVWRVLRTDRWFMWFMVWMFMLGFGNLMIMPVLIITLREQFGLKYLQSILISTTIPSLVMLVAIPIWARLLDRAHVVKFRSIHSWSFVLATAAMLAGAWLHRLEFMYLGSVFWGVGLGGGTLAWSLGHVDFAPPSQTSHYMATHVTLNGVRGLVAPIVAVQAHSWLAGREGVEAIVGGRIMGVLPADPSTVVFGLALVISCAGAIGFVGLRRSMGTLLRGIKRAA
jgi:hypothetical protein